jgi:hypothetical protein
VLFRLKTPPPQDGTRHYCRFPKCRSKLPKPVTSARDAFCTVGCVRGFFRSRCRICERQFERQNEKEKTCGRRECRAAFRRDSERFSGPRWGDAPFVVRPSKKPIKPGVKIAPSEGPTVWQVIAGPTPSKANLIVPLDPDLIARPARQPAHVQMAEIDRKARHRSARTAVFKRRTLPANITGGYRFPGAPEVDLSPIEAPAPTWAATPSRWEPVAVVTAGSADLSIPDFLKRPSAVSSRPTAEREEPSSLPGDGSKQFGR